MQYDEMIILGTDSKFTNDSAIFSDNTFCKP